MCIFNSFYLLHSYNLSFLICLCFNMVSFRDQKKLGPRPDRSPLLRGLIQNFRRASKPLSYAEFPPPRVEPTFLLSFNTRRHTSMASSAILSKISLKNSELKTTHNTLRDCRVHFFRQPFSKYGSCIHSHNSLENYTLFQTKISKMYTSFQTEKAQKHIWSA